MKGYNTEDGRRERHFNAVSTKDRAAKTAARRAIKADAKARIND